MGNYEATVSSPYCPQLIIFYDIKNQKMKNNNIKTSKYVILIVLFFGIILNSCQERYHDVELPQMNPKLVVNSLFNEGERIRVSISTSLGRNSTEQYTPVINATVNLYENGEWVEELKGGQNTINIFGDTIGKWFYFSRTTLPKAENVYKINVEAPGFESISAESKVPQKTVIHVVDTAWIKIEWDYYLRVYLEMENPSEKHWFYLGTANLNPIFSSSGGEDPPIIGFNKRYFNFRVNDPLIGTRERRANEDFPLFSNELFPGDFYKFAIEVNRLNTIGESFAVDLITLSDEAYKYLQTVTDFKNNDIRYSEPVKIFSNVKDGLGIFAAINTSCDTVWLNGN
jgi:hypothetical protein